MRVAVVTGSSSGNGYETSMNHTEGFKKLLLGSITSSIVTYAHCPVMVVK
jgi:nucleotide-binding universal stress UspA family protein